MSAINHPARASVLSTSHDAAHYVVASGRTACTWWPVAPGSNFNLAV